jgi:hypothetical protein
MSRSSSSRNIPTAVPFVTGTRLGRDARQLSIALVVAFACFGWYAARAGQPLLGNAPGVNRAAGEHNGHDGY